MPTDRMTKVLLAARLRSVYFSTRLSTYSGHQLRLLRPVRGTPD